MHTATLAAGVLSALALSACMHPNPAGAGAAYDPGYGYGHGPGHGWAPGAWHMGPGMMGPGMMGGPGAGMMMGHPGGLWGLERLDLSPEQRSRIAALQDEARQQHAALMRAWQAEAAPPGDAADDAGDRRSYDAMAARHKQMFEMHLQTRRRILEVLTPEQRDQLGRAWRGRR